MSRSERFANEREIIKAFNEFVSGPILKYNAGEYLVDGREGHAIIMGESGTGKTRREIEPMIINNITSEDKESWIIVDPKGDIYERTVGFASDDYDIYKFDFRSLYEEGNTCWNPLTEPYELWVSGTVENRCRAYQLVDALAHTMFPVAPNTDPFWMTEARNLFMGAVYALFSYAKPEEVNLSSVFYLVQKGEARFGASNYLKELVELEAENENVAMQLYSYLTTANETRGGIRSSFLSKLSMATKSESLRSFLSNDDIHINDLMGDKPVLIYVILPDETPIYDELAGVLISQLMNHYIYIAEKKWGGKLPIRVNFCLDELGNIGRAIGNLPHLLSAGRSRNVRVELVLQSLSQLDDIYGRSNATTIISNAAVKIAFRMNHWETLSELSRLCGEREVIIDGKAKQQPLITPSQLGAMEVGQALVIVSGRIKFVTWLPDYTEVFDVDKMVRTKGCIGSTKRNKTQVFDIQKYVKEKKRQEMLKSIDNSNKDIEENKLPFPSSMNPFANVGQGTLNGFDIDKMIKEIDEKIAALDEEEKAEKERLKRKKTNKKKNVKKETSVVILGSESRVKDIRVISDCLKLSKTAAYEMYKAGERNGFVEIRGLSREDAYNLAEQLKEIGNAVVIDEKEDEV